MHKPERFLHLHLRAAKPQLVERVIARHPDIVVRGNHAIVPLAHYRAEEVMAECRRLGLVIVSSAVKAGLHTG